MVRRYSGQDVVLTISGEEFRGVKSVTFNSIAPPSVEEFDHSGEGYRKLVYRASDIPDINQLKSTPLALKKSFSVTGTWDVLWETTTGTRWTSAVNLEQAQAISSTSPRLCRKPLTIVVDTN